MDKRENLKNKEIVTREEVIDKNGAFEEKAVSENQINYKKAMEVSEV